jgi:hypothetical protein
MQDLNRLGIILREGAAMMLCSFELEAEGTVTYSSEEGMWVAVADGITSWSFLAISCRRSHVRLSTDTL